MKLEILILEIALQFLKSFHPARCHIDYTHKFSLVYKTPLSFMKEFRSCFLSKPMNHGDLLFWQLRFFFTKIWFLS